MASILVIDDDSLFCDLLAAKLRRESYEVVCAATLYDGCAKAAAGTFDVVYLDVRLPDGNGLDKVSFFLNVASRPEVIIMTGMGDPDGAELAIKNGAWDYIKKPSSISNLMLPLFRALQYREIKLAGKPSRELKREGIVGNSARMKICLDQIAQAACSDASVLISGETGTGKELAAWAIHNNSARAAQNFVVVDCASLSETLVEATLFGHEKGAFTGAEKANTGLIKQADGGTLFLDEVGELPFSIQKAFLRVLQEHRFRPLGGKQEVSSDFRLLAATNRDLDRMVKDGTFRDDLLFRLRSFSIQMPALRERIDDITDLAIYHAKKIAQSYETEPKGLSGEFMHALKSYSWPGNVRELVNTMERCVAVAGNEPMLLPHHLPVDIRIQIARESVRGQMPEEFTGARTEGHPLPRWQDFRENALIWVEKQYLQSLFANAGSDMSKALEISGLSRSRFYELIKKHNMSRLD